MDYLLDLLDSDGKKDKYYTSFEKNQSVRPIRIEQLVKEENEKEVKIGKKYCIVECDEINCIGDLIQLALKYPNDTSTEYTNIRINSLHKIVPHLKQLDEMIGLKSLKKSMTDQLIYYLQLTDKTNDYKHTIISGPPGTGKTEIAKLIGNIFSLLGVFGDGPAKFKQVSRGDLVAGYLGQTAIKTNEVINSCLGGVLFIDEAYSLGNVDKRDAYSKECIDTLCDALSSHRHDLMVIIAGYDSELNDCFFGYNQGLKSRFAWKYNIDGYSAEELSYMFLLKLTKLTNTQSTLEMGMLSKWFSKRMNHFTSYGRDIDTFIGKIKIAHSRRTFCKTDDGITMADVEKGYESVCLLHPPLAPKQHDLFFYS
jgi:SpoVK/Ycf46/Vps4 family AAA+-type ATPase